MGSSRLVGLDPALPWPLNGSSWWTEPVRAERLAALRVGTAVVLLLDIFLFYWPTASGLYPPGTRGDPELLHVRDAAYAWSWSLLRGLTDPHAVQLGLLIWAAAGVLLLLGIGT